MAVVRQLARTLGILNVLSCVVPKVTHMPEAALRLRAAAEKVREVARQISLRSEAIRLLAEAAALEAQAQALESAFAPGKRTAGSG